MSFAIGHQLSSETDDLESKKPQLAALSLPAEPKQFRQQYAHAQGGPAESAYCRRQKPPPEQKRSADKISSNIIRAGIPQLLRPFTHEGSAAYSEFSDALTRATPRSSTKIDIVSAPVQADCPRLGGAMIGLLAFAAALNTTAPPDLRGTAGVCIRWDGPEHIGDAIVVVSSGNPALDAAIPSRIEAMRWQRPATTKRGWTGLAFTAQGEPSDMALPECTLYALPKLPGR